MKIGNLLEHSAFASMRSEQIATRRAPHPIARIFGGARWSGFSNGRLQSGFLLRPDAHPANTSQTSSAQLAADRRSLRSNTELWLHSSLARRYRPEGFRPVGLRRTAAAIVDSIRGHAHVYLLVCPRRGPYVGSVGPYYSPTPIDGRPPEVFPGVAPHLPGSPDGTGIEL